MAENYRPILTRPAGLCRDARVLSLVASEPGFDVRRLEADEVVRECASLAEAQSKRGVVADAISAYGKQLALLAGADPGVLTADIEGVAKAAKGIKDSGGDALFNASKVDALTKVVTIVVELARAGKAQRLTRKVLDEAHEPLATLVEEMKVWTQGTVLPRLKTGVTRREIVLDKGLVPASSAASVPGAREVPGLTYTARLAQFSLAKEIEGLKADQKTAEAFTTTATALVDSHGKLRDLFDSPDQQARLDAVKDFVDKVRALRTAAQSLWLVSHTVMRRTA
ncbi:MAG: hypothetical protein HZC37_27510 [Burkholderiales bacterium]|nr:hypothetical protein [Burkholderiales bacterium]